jgi:hypothetical protein
MSPDSSKKRLARLLRPRNWPLALLAVWLAGGAALGIAYAGPLRTAWLAPRLPRPVVTVESDDWGVGFVLGQQRQAEQDANQAAGLEAICRVLAAHSDSRGRRGILTGFFVPCQPEAQGILDSPGQFTSHRCQMPKLMQAARQARADGLLEVGYHVHYHVNPARWSEAVREASAQARRTNAELTGELLERLLPAESLNDELANEYYSADQHGLKPLPEAELKSVVDQGIAHLRAELGVEPVSTVGPRNLWPAALEPVWSACGIRYVHGANQQRQADSQRPWLRELGCPLEAGLVGVPRNVWLEVRKHDQWPELEAVLSDARRIVAHGQPIVITTHAFNYCPADAPRAQRMARLLDELLGRLGQQHPSLLYLSGSELGQFAVAGELGLHTEDLSARLSRARGWQHLAMFWRSASWHLPRLRWWAWGLMGFLGLAVIVRLAAVRTDRRKRMEKPA